MKRLTTRPPKPNEQADLPPGTYACRTCAVEVTLHIRACSVGCTRCGKFLTRAEDRTPN